MDNNLDSTARIYFKSNLEKIYLIIYSNTECKHLEKIFAVLFANLVLGLTQTKQAA